MSGGDVDSIGSHCQMVFCHQLDFLPFRCASCHGTYCLQHRSESSHSCKSAGAWAQQRQSTAATSSPSPNRARPSILTHEQQCSEPSCKTLIYTPLTAGVHCDDCRRSYCLRHRFGHTHDCTNLTPIGVSPVTGLTQKEKGLAALEKLRAWGAARKAAAAIPARLPPFLTTFKSDRSTHSRSSGTGGRLQEIATLKKLAKGDEKIAPDQRVYIYIEASPETITAEVPREKVFYNATWNVGRVLDLAAKTLQVKNINNRASVEEEKLRVFHVESGRILQFGERLSTLGVTNGHTLVLLRGIGSDITKSPDHE